MCSIILGCKSFNFISKSPTKVSQNTAILIFEWFSLIPTGLFIIYECMFGVLCNSMCTHLLLWILRLFQTTIDYWHWRRFGAKSSPIMWKQIVRPISQCARSLSQATGWLAKWLTEWLVGWLTRWRRKVAARYTK